MKEHHYRNQAGEELQYRVATEDRRIKVCYFSAGEKEHLAIFALHANKKGTLLNREKRGMDAGSTFHETHELVGSS